MEIRNCRGCGKLFNYIGGPGICPACKEEVEAKFVQVKEYIEENKKASISQISEDNQVSMSQLRQWIREERLIFSEDSLVGIDCEICGKTIRTGRFCDSCKNTMAQEFGNVYSGSGKKGEAEEKLMQELREKARVRYLDTKK